MFLGLRVWQDQRNENRRKNHINFLSTKYFFCETLYVFLFEAPSRQSVYALIATWITDGGGLGGFKQQIRRNRNFLGYQPHS